MVRRNPVFAMLLGVAFLGPVFFGLAGCEFDALNLAGRTCPCALGYTCTPTGCVAGSIDAVGGTDTVVGQDSATIDREDVSTQDGSADAGGVDSGPEESRCGGDWILCENFDIPLVAWEGSIPRPARDTGRVHRGAASLRIDIDDELTHYLSKDLGTNVRAGDLYIRYFVYLPGAAYPGDLHPLELTETTPDEGIFQTVTSNQTSLRADLAREEAEMTSGTIPSDDWTCMTMHVQFRFGEVTVATAINSEPAATLVTEAGTGFSGLTQLAIGYRSWPDTPSGPYAYYIDSFAVAETPVGCDE